MDRTKWSGIRPCQIKKASCCWYYCVRWWDASNVGGMSPYWIWLVLSPLTMVQQLQMKASQMEQGNTNTQSTFSSVMTSNMLNHEKSPIIVLLLKLLDLSLCHSERSLLSLFTKHKHNNQGKNLIFWNKLHQQGTRTLETNSLQRKF